VVLVDYDVTMIQRELDLNNSLILYLDSELKKSIEEIDAIQCKKEAIRLEEAALFQKWEEIKRDYRRLCDSFDSITCPDFIKRIEDPERKKKLKDLARRWKKIRETSPFKQAQDGTIIYNPTQE
jgi:hypothetical protein